MVSKPNHRDYINHNLLFTAIHVFVCRTKLEMPVFKPQYAHESMVDAQSNNHLVLKIFEMGEI